MNGVARRSKVVGEPKESLRLGVSVAKQQY
jgi:hypothetical protein